VRTELASCAVSEADVPHGEAPGDAARLTSDALELLDHARQAGDVELLKEAVTGFRTVQIAVSPGDLSYEVAVGNLASALVALFEWSGDLGIPDEVITLLSQRFQGKEREAGRLSVRGWALQRQAELSGDAVKMKQAVAAHRRALNMTGKSDPAYSDRLSGLGSALALQYAVTGNATVLGQAIGLHKGAVARSAASDPGRAARLSNLGTALGLQAARTGTIAILRCAVSRHRQAVGAAGANDPGRAIFLANLGAALLREYEEDGSPAVLDEATRRQREAVALTPDDHVERAPRLANLAGALTAFYERARSHLRAWARGPCRSML
jgi:hypothetical protein